MDTLPSLLKDLPASFWDVPYDGARYPGSGLSGALADGANCHVFAYAILAEFGFHLPPLRSAELWRDTDATQVVLTPRPLDLVLFHDREQAWGAHVGVVCGEDEVVHLCAEVGRPAVWSFADFARSSHYAHLIGYKRPLPA